VALFHYPKVRHIRTKSPAYANDYRRYKSFLREEFDGTCVYCRKPDRLGDLDAFGVDHYRPKKRFPSLATTYSNLFYACNTCNRRKGQFWPSGIQQQNGQFVPNPCDYTMFDHLRSGAAGQVDPHSKAGEWTIDLLLLNESVRVDFRKAMVQALSLARGQKRQLKETIEELEKRAKATDGATQETLISEKKSHELRLKDVETMLRTLTGS
jgi:uncharacterized protein (TIGR02646 family)